MNLLQRWRARRAEQQQREAQITEAMTCAKCRHCWRIMYTGTRSIVPPEPSFTYCAGCADQPAEHFHRTCPVCTYRWVQPRHDA